MFITSTDFSSELADIGLAAAADPQFAERLMAALLRESAPIASNCGAEDMADAQRSAAA